MLSTLAEKLTQQTKESKSKIKSVFLDHAF